MPSKSRDPLIAQYMSEVSVHPLIPIEEEEVLAAKIQAGDEAARERMILGNLRFVVHIAADYIGYGMSLPDLISEGNIGLMKAVERFDPKKGGKMSTYAGWWIKQRIKRALANQGRVVRLPVHVVDRLHRVRRVTAQMQACLGRIPTNIEIADEIGMTEERLEELHALQLPAASLDAPKDEDNPTTPLDMLPDGALTPDQRMASSEDVSKLARLMVVLTKREKTVIKARYGIGRKQLTLEVVGEKLGVTRERVRQIQNSALEKMSRAAARAEAGAKID